MSIVRVLLILAALVLAYLFGLLSMLGAIRKEYPATYRAFLAEMQKKNAAKAAAQGDQEGE